MAGSTRESLHNGRAAISGVVTTLVTVVLLDQALYPQEILATSMHLRLSVAAVVVGLATLLLLKQPSRLRWAAGTLAAVVFIGWFVGDPRSIDGTITNLVPRMSVHGATAVLTGFWVAVAVDDRRRTPTRPTNNHPVQPKASSR